MISTMLCCDLIFIQLLLLQYYCMVCMYCFNAVIFLFVFYTTLVSELRSLFIFSFRGRVLQHTIMTCCLAPWVRRRAVQRICKSSLSSRAVLTEPLTIDRELIATGFIKILYITFYNIMVLIPIAYLVSYENIYCAERGTHNRHKTNISVNY